MLAARVLASRLREVATGSTSWGLPCCHLGIKPSLLSSALLSFLLAAGCESLSSDGTSVTCDATDAMSGHTCAVFSGTGVATTCVAGTRVASCSGTGVLGTCVYSLPAGGVTESVTITYYSEGMVTVATAAMACSAFNGATWIPQ